jgi:predicted secreted protein
MAVAFSLASFPVLAAEEVKPKGTLIDFSVEASRPAVNDMGRATVYAEVSGSNPAELARQVNSAISAALEKAKAYEKVRTQSGNTQTRPVYGKDGRITGWRIRSELLLESRDMMALSELLGRAQESSLAIGQVAVVPSPETQKKAEDEATLEALAAFQAKAKLIADAMKKTYRIRQMNISSGPPPDRPVMLRAARMAAMEAAPAPIEAGESRVSVTISGQIELGE